MSILNTSLKVHGWWSECPWPLQGCSACPSVMFSAVKTNTSIHKHLCTHWQTQPTAFLHTFKAVSFLLWIINSALKVQQLFLFSKNKLMSSTMDLSLVFLRAVYRHDVATFSQSSCFASLCFANRGSGLFQHHFMVPRELGPGNSSSKYN